ncbi:MAG: chromosomal replication initiator protein DnaA [Clostridia bacterium]|nr:chromosomal replication initiator protein DnaA [Clostridia bacterium]
MENGLTEICDAVLALLRERYAQNVFAVWFRDLKMEELGEDSAVFSTNVAFKLRYLDLNYKPVIEECLSTVMGATFTVSFTVREGDFHRPVFEKEEEDEEILDEEPLSINTNDIQNPRTIVERYTFENFLVADSNRFAHAAALAVARFACDKTAENENLYNPLFIYGRSGLGKTHLLYAITNEIKKRNNEIRIIYKRGEDFTTELISAMQNNSTAAFRSYYRNADILLIDDIQFIAGKVQTQEEFFHTFSALYEDGKQIILTSDRPPREIRPLEERLLTRFEWGQLADIQPPSAELRTAIIKKKAAEANLLLPDDVIEYLQQNLTENIRQIEGAIHRLKGITMITSQKVTLDMCRRNVADLLRTPTVTQDIVNRIFRVVSRKYEIHPDDLKGNRRTQSIARARHICIYIVHQMTDLSLSAIGVQMDRDHATIINSIKWVEKAVRETPSLEYDIEEIIREVRS